MLSAHPAVRQSVVLAREDRPADKHLVAYVVGDATKLGAGDDLAGERIANWKTLYEDLYRKADGRQESAFDITGWNSSYTGVAIPADQMCAWRRNTVARIRSLGADRVWELGCGTGLLLLDVAGGCSDYLGTDFSSQALETLRGEVESRGYNQVRLQACPAHNFSGITSGQFDLVVLNSVVQYFPSLDYLRHVLQGAANSLSADGVLFVGDVRSLPLLETFHASVQAYRAAADLPIQELRERVQRAVEIEEELTLDPDYFRSLCRELPQLSHAEVLLKRGRDDNEMTRYRYDVFLYMGAAAEPVQVSRSLDWSLAVGDLQSLARLLENGPAVVEVLGIPNARVHADQLCWQAGPSPGNRRPAWRACAGSGFGDRTGSVLGTRRASGLHSAADLVTAGRRLCGCAVPTAKRQRTAAVLGSGPPSRDPNLVRSSQQPPPDTPVAAVGPSPAFLSPGQAARIHDSLSVRDARAIAADAQRQGGPPQPCRHPRLAGPVSATSTWYLARPWNDS